VLINKPLGLSSQQVVTRVKRILGVKKAGHTGSLDPMATGMLPVCFGRATKLCEYFLEADKHYRADIFLGVKTDSGDKEGKLIESAPVPVLTESLIKSVLAGFRGVQLQIPPMYSALKHQGKCLYELARKGIEIEREPRQIEIYAIQALSFQESVLTIEVRCSKGTYIRVLGEDIAEKLGTVGHLSALHRVSCAGFLESAMCSLEELLDSPEKIIPLNRVLSIPVVELTAGQVDHLMMGKPLEFEDNTLSGRFQLTFDQQVIAVAWLTQGHVQERKIIEC
jgi:tRNA pseudouridine55 synthase